MSDLNSTLFSLVLIAGTALIAVLIIVLLRIARAITSVKGEVSDIKDTLLPLIKNVDSLTVNLDRTIQDLNGYKSMIDASLRNVMAITENLYRLETTVQERIEPGVLQFADFVMRIQQGVRNFSQRWKQRKR